MIKYIKNEFYIFQVQIKTSKFNFLYQYFAINISLQVLVVWLSRKDINNMNVDKSILRLILCYFITIYVELL